MLHSIHKIAIFRALQLGDLLCAIPALRALRKAFPSAHISLISLPWAVELAKRFPHYIDELIVFPGCPGLPEQPVPSPQAVKYFTAYMREHQFDLLLQMQGNGNIVNALLEDYGAKVLAGFCREDNYCPDSFTFVKYPDHLNEIERHLYLLNFLNVPSAGTALEFPLNEQDQLDFRKLELPFNFGEYICVHPGSRGAARQWPVVHFAELADHFARKGWGIVLTGTAGEAVLAERVRLMMKMPAVNLAGKTTLGSLAVLISQAAALFSNCTGVSHIAAAVQTPSVIISMDGEPKRWAPLNQHLHHVVDWTQQQEYQTVLQEAEEMLA